MNPVGDVPPKEEWLTPPEIIKALGQFDLDPCSPINRPWDTAEHHFDKNIDGLAQSWSTFSRIWLNPPYGKQTFNWLTKRRVEQRNGIALIYARTDTIGFHREVFNAADAIFFFRGRLRFYMPDGQIGNSGATAPSCLVAYGADNIAAILNANFDGKLTYLQR